MRTPQSLDRELDLLRQRRLERGLPAEVAPLVPARRLLVHGAAAGVVPLLLVATLSTWVGWRQAQVSEQLSGLRGIPAQLQALESQVSERRRQFTAVQRSNEGLAKGLVAVSSGSALLAQLAAITPQGVQITDLQVQGSGLSLKGLANDPQSFRSVNGLSLLLARSPLIQPASVKVLKISREQPTGTGAQSTVTAGPVAWDLNASFASVPAARQLALLQQLGAVGMVRRLQILQRAGVLP